MACEPTTQLVDVTKRVSMLYSSNRYHVEEKTELATVSLQQPKVDNSPLRRCV